MKNDQLMKVATDVGLPHQKALLLLDEFKRFFEEIGAWEVEAFRIVVTNDTQTAIMKKAGDGRKKVQRIRKDLEDSRVLQKRNALMEGKAIDGMANIIKAIIKPIEEHLYAQEHFVKIRDAAIEKERREKADRLLEEKERKAQLRQERKIEKDRLENIRLRKLVKKQDFQLTESRSETKSAQEKVVELKTEVKETESLVTEQMQENEDLRNAVFTATCPDCGKTFSPKLPDWLQIS